MATIETFNQQLKKNDAERKKLELRKREKQWEHIQNVCPEAKEYETRAGFEEAGHRFLSYHGNPKRGAKKGKLIERCIYIEPNRKKILSKGFSTIAPSVKTLATDAFGVCNDRLNSTIPRTIPKESGDITPSFQVKSKLHKKTNFHKECLAVTSGLRGLPPLRKVVSDLNTIAHQVAEKEISFEEGLEFINKIPKVISLDNKEMVRHINEIGTITDLERHPFYKELPGQRKLYVPLQEFPSKDLEEIYLIPPSS